MKKKKKSRVPAGATSGGAPGRRALRLHGSIARDIGVAIVSGRFRPGQVLEGEVEASVQRRVSRTAYREAVRILAAKGLVHSRPREFHAALLLATANPFIVSLTNGVTAAVDSLTEFKQRIAPLKRDPIPDHRRVYDAIAAKDSEGARVAMAELIRLAIMDMPLKQRPRAPIAGQASRLAQYS